MPFREASWGVAVSVRGIRTALRRAIFSCAWLGSLLLVLFLAADMLAPSSTQHAQAAPSGTIGAVPGDVRQFLRGLKVMNYYPAHNGWIYMWERWNPATIAADFTRIAALHANTVRIIIQVPAFGYPVPRSSMQAHLAQAVSLAAARGLRVQLTLFDWWGLYQDVAGSRRWAGALLAPYSRDRRIAFVELQNELNPANPAALAWARATIPSIRSLMHGIPVTISVNTGQVTAQSPGMTVLQAHLRKLQSLVAALRATPPDFYTFHSYIGPEAALTYATLQQAQQIVAPLPLFVGEVGFSTSLHHASAELPAASGALEAYQDHYYRTVNAATRALGLPVAAPWVLYDFAEGAIPPGDTAAQPVEYGNGLFRVDGTPKPAAISEAEFFATGAVADSFNNSFETGYNAGSVSLPAEWRLFHPAQGHFARDTTVSHSGAASARISGSTGASTGLPAFFLSPIDANVTPGQICTASAWVSGRNASGITQVALAWFDASGTYLHSDESAPLPPGTTSWRQLIARGAAPPAAAYVQIHLQSANNAGSAWFDDVAFSKVP